MPIIGKRLQCDRSGLAPQDYKITRTPDTRRVHQLASLALSCLLGDAGSGSPNEQGRHTVRRRICLENACVLYRSFDDESARCPTAAVNDGS